MMKNMCFHLCVLFTLDSLALSSLITSKVLHLGIKINQINCDCDFCRCYAQKKLRQFFVPMTVKNVQIENYKRKTETRRKPEAAEEEVQTKNNPIVFVKPIIN